MFIDWTALDSFIPKHPSIQTTQNGSNLIITVMQCIRSQWWRTQHTHTHIHSQSPHLCVVSHWCIAAGPIYFDSITNFHLWMRWWGFLLSSRFADFPICNSYSFIYYFYSSDFQCAMRSYVMLRTRNKPIASMAKKCVVIYIIYIRMICMNGWLRSASRKINEGKRIVLVLYSFIIIEPQCTLTH